MNDVRIAFDLDNVLCNILDSARRHIARARRVRIDDIIDTNVYASPFTHADPAIAATLATDHAFWGDRQMVTNCGPIEGAVAAAWKAHDAGALAAYVTRRSGSLRELTAEWMRDWGFPNAPIHHVGDNDEELNHATCKSVHCIEEGATHLVDDSQGEAAGAIAAGIVPILIDHPLGREARNRWLAENPGVALAADAEDAVRIALGI